VNSLAVKIDLALAKWIQHVVGKGLWGEGLFEDLPGA